MPDQSRRTFLSSSLLLTGAWGLQHRPELQTIAGDVAARLTPPAPVPDREAVSRIIEDTRERSSWTPPEIDTKHQSYASYVTSLGLRYIQPWEVIAPHKKVRNGVQNSIPPRHLWKNMAQTLLVADELRHRLGIRMHTIASAYRSPAYNAQCSGAATRSTHMQNMALDLMFDASPRRVATMAKTLRREGFFRGGIGTYRSFVHIDTRGHNATWG